MKVIDVDAKQMIRTYIDSIEEYFQDHTRLHPNEIDGLLNEINDFIYLRSTEISADPERVTYSDVLKAIEECGSPSEICGQFLEREKIRSEVRSTTEQNDSTSRKGDKDDLIRTMIAHNKNGKLNSSDGNNRYSEKKSKINDKNYSLYSYSGTFTLYRLGFILILSYLLIRLILHPFYNDYYWDGANEASIGFCLSITLFILVLVILEGLIINRWKDKLNKESQLDRSLDDSLISWISRFSFLLIFLKCSLLDFMVYLFFIPIWLGIFVFLESKLKSSFWKEFLSPKLISIGERLSSSETQPTYPEYRHPSIWERIRPYLFWIECIISTILLILLGMTFFLRPLENVDLSSDITNLWTVLTIIAVIIPLILISNRKAKKSPFINSSSYELYYGKFGIILWLIRLLIIKIVLIQTTYNYSDNNLSFLFVIMLVILLIISEVVFETYGGDSLKFGIGKIFVMFGSSSTISVEKKDRAIKSIDFQEQKVDNRQARSAPSKIILKNKNLVDSRDITSSSDIRSVPSNSGEMTYSSVQTYARKREPSILLAIIYRILSITFLILKIFVMACIMLLISVYEVILAFIIIVTAGSSNGSYQIPVFEFYIPTKISTSFDLVLVEFGGFIIWSWYALFLLGFQIFLVAMLQFYGLASKKPEGIVVKIGRNLSRIFIGLLIASTFIQATYNDTYAIIRLMILVFLTVFNELSAWKTHFERKRWVIPSNEPLLKLQQKNESQTIQTKSS